MEEADMPISEMRLAQDNSRDLTWGINSDDKSSHICILHQQLSSDADGNMLPVTKILKVFCEPALPSNLVNISFNRNYSALLLYSHSQIVVLNLPQRLHDLILAGFREGKSEISYKSITPRTKIWTKIGEHNLYTSFRGILNATWHPYSHSHLGVLRSDNVFMCFNVAKDPVEAEQTIHLEELKRDDNICPAISFEHSQKSRNPHALGGTGFKVIQFCFGEVALGVSSESNARNHESSFPAVGAWMPFTLFFMLSDGSIMHICPFIPHSATLPKQLFENLKDFVQPQAVPPNRKPSKLKERELDNIYKWISENFVESDKGISTKHTRTEYLKLNSLFLQWSAEPYDSSDYDQKENVYEIGCLNIISSKWPQVLLRCDMMGVVDLFLCLHDIVPMWNHDVRPKFAANEPLLHKFETVDMEVPYLSYPVLVPTQDHFQPNSFYFSFAGGIITLSVEWLPYLEEFSKSWFVTDKADLQEIPKSEFYKLYDSDPLSRHIAAPPHGVAVISSFRLGHQIIVLKDVSPSAISWIPDDLEFILLDNKKADSTNSSALKSKASLLSSRDQREKSPLEELLAKYHSMRLPPKISTSSLDSADDITLLKFVKKTRDDLCNYVSMMEAMHLRISSALADLRDKYEDQDQEMDKLNQIMHEMKRKNDSLCERTKKIVLKQQELMAQSRALLNLVTDLESRRSREEKEFHDEIFQKHRLLPRMNNELHRLESKAQSLANTVSTIPTPVISEADLQKNILPALRHIKEMEADVDKRLKVLDINN